MYKRLLFLLLMLSIAKLQAQQLLFINKTNNKIVTINIGCKLMLTYVGYNYQPEYYQNTVTNITDSTITLGLSFFSKKTSPTSAKINQTKTIRIADIIAFRKRSAVAEIGKNVLHVTAAVTTIVLLRNLYSKSNISTLNAFGISIASGFLVNKSINLLFPENAKYVIGNSWESRFVNY